MTMKLASPIMEVAPPEKGSVSPERHSVPVLLWTLCSLIGPPMSRFRSCPVWSQLSDKLVTSAEIRSRSKRVHFAHSSLLPVPERLRLRKSYLNKKTMLFFETMCIPRRDPIELSFCR
ncbi:hypothetical protein MTP99_018628 [Tenebrio molitor]|nr:hypothetical protein MTP99_018628 [Tenebrio molitor]